MSGRLPLEQGTELIRRLASDDAFRDLFERDPASAMLEAGISTDVIDTLAAKCRLARTLAPKSAFVELLDDVNSVASQAFMQMHTPEARLSRVVGSDQPSLIETLRFPASARA